MVKSTKEAVDAPKDKLDVSWIEKLKQDIDRAIEGYLDSLVVSDFSSGSSHAEEALGMLREFSKRPGKRLRGILCVLAYQAQGGKNNAIAIQAAVAIELIQNYLLMVDDVMDQSAVRRGGVAVHEKYAGVVKDYGVTTSQSRHASNMLGINIGLVTQHIASSVLLSVKTEETALILANKLMQANILNTCFGQIDDTFNAFDDNVSEDAIIATYKSKSSHYTFINPLQIGAALAGADDKELDQLKAVGSSAGVAFQIKDDIIGTFGEPEVTGKSSIDDIKEGKITLLVCSALQKADTNEKTAIKRTLGRKDASLDDYRVFKEILQKSGALTYTEEQALRYANMAKKAIGDLGWSEKHKKILLDIIEFITMREK